MDKSSVLKLISVTYTDDTIGQKVPTETTRNVFCSVESVTQSEWFNAGNAGLKAEYRAVMFAPEYKGEELCELNGVRYGIYRTYLTNNEEIELYLERKAGVRSVTTS